MLAAERDQFKAIVPLCHCRQSEGRGAWGCAKERPGCMEVGQGDTESHEGGLASFFHCALNRITRRKVRTVPTSSSPGGRVWEHHEEREGPPFWIRVGQTDGWTVGSLVYQPLDG
jgi:hypothetical protein